MDSQSAYAHACEVRGQILGALTWALRQRRLVVKACGSSHRDRFIPWINVFGEQARTTRSTGSMISLESSTHNLVSFSTDARNRIVWNAGEGNGSEAWMRRVAILQQVQNPSRCQRVKDLGPALEDWLSKKRQYEMFTDRNGRPCQASDDSLVAAMFRLMPKNLEETVMFTNEDERLPGVV